MNLLEVNELAEAVDENPYEILMSAEYIEEAQRLGYRIVIPAADELQIDIDSPEDRTRFDYASEILFRWVAPLLITEKPSRSGEGRVHITIRLPFNLEPWQRIAFQAALGSDITREVLSCVQLLHGDPNPVLFAELKE